MYLEKFEKFSSKKGYRSIFSSSNIKVTETYHLKARKGRRKIQRKQVKTGKS